MHPEILLDVVKYFSDLRVCNQYMRKIKWPHGLMPTHRMPDSLAALPRLLRSGGAAPFYGNASNE